MSLLERHRDTAVALGSMNTDGPAVAILAGLEVIARSLAKGTDDRAA